MHLASMRPLDAFLRLSVMAGESFGSCWSLVTKAGVTEAPSLHYTFMTGVSCSRELCGRIVLLLECSFSKFCKKPLFFRPSRITVLLVARLTRVLQDETHTHTFSLVDI